MKIYILKHEDCTQDYTFFSPLTSVGLKNSINLVDIIKKYNINHIYSSPFIKTLQTIKPYVEEKQLKIKIDYSLSEMMQLDIIPKKSYQVRLPDYIAKLFNYDEHYKSQIEPEDLSYPENDKNVELRIKKILKYIISSYSKDKDTDNNILIVTHEACCLSIIKIIKKFGILNVPKHDIISYPRGGLSLIFNKNTWSFDAINWKIKI
jgi:broad specificity phosphatase PhoE